MRILIMPRYTPNGASSRYRFWQYVPGLQRAGHEVVVKPLLENGYLTELYRTGRRSWRWLARGYAARLFDAQRGEIYDATLCEHEVFPFLPGFAEMLLAKFNKRFILDYDDAAHCKYHGWPVLHEKIPHLMRVAERVVVGNHHLASYARQFTPYVSVIPTVVDLAAYFNRQCSAPSGIIRIAWIGTPMTASFLTPLIPIFLRLQGKHPRLRFRFIGAGNFSADGLHTETREWSVTTEARLLSECDIGVMPLPDTEFTRGKCGLKLIQYMASGLPVVASPIGANCEIVEENQNGFLAADPDEWFEKLDALIASAELRQRLGNSGRAKVAAQYTLEHGLSKWLEILETTTPQSGQLPPQENPSPSKKAHCAVRDAGWPVPVHASSQDCCDSHCARRKSLVTGIKSA